MNLLLTLFGWIIWNFTLFTIEKDKFDNTEKEFSFRVYAKTHWDNWVLSLFFIPVLIILGIKGFKLEALPIDDFAGMKWGDLYYLGAGAFAEVAKYYITLIIKKYTT